MRSFEQIPEPAQEAARTPSGTEIDPSSKEGVLVQIKEYAALLGEYTKEAETYLGIAVSGNLKGERLGVAEDSISEMEKDIATRKKDFRSKFKQLFATYAPGEYDDVEALWDECSRSEDHAKAVIGALKKEYFPSPKPLEKVLTKNNKDIPSHEAGSANTHDRSFDGDLTLSQKDILPPGDEAIIVRINLLKVTAEKYLAELMNYERISKQRDLSEKEIADQKTAAQTLKTFIKNDSKEIQAVKVAIESLRKQNTDGAHDRVIKSWEDHLDRTLSLGKFLG